MMFINTVRFLFIVSAGVCGIVISNLVKEDIVTMQLLGCGLIGAAIGLTIVLIETQIRHAEPKTLIVGMCGFLAGMVTAQVLVQTVPTDLILATYNARLALGSIDSAQEATRFINSVTAVSIIASLFFAYLGTVIALRYAHRIDLSRSKFIRQETADHFVGAKVLDSSVLIDGRITDIATTAFMEGTLILPRFILRELQTIADSSDPIRRRRGRRGLDVVKQLQENANVRIEIIDIDYPAIKDVDSKIVALAKDIGGKVLTNDYNLNKVASIQSVQVLNINDLANSLKTIVLPGEELSVMLVKEGKEQQQGVGYLDDGTMVVVENGKSFLTRHVDVLITSVLQTPAGRMIFAKLKDEAA